MLYEFQYHILLRSAISIRIWKYQRTQRWTNGRLSWGRWACGAPARSHPLATAGDPRRCARLVLSGLARHQLTQPGPGHGRPGRETRARDTYFLGNAANPARGCSLFAPLALAVGQGALHATDFAADATARHCLEVRAVAQGLGSQFL